MNTGTSHPSTSINDRHLDFSQSTVLGLNNPQVLSGLESLYEVSDHDFIILLFDESDNFYRGYKSMSRYKSIMMVVTMS